MKKIKLTQSKFTLVDDEDYEYLNGFKWYAAKFENYYYAIRNISDLCGNQRSIRMHRVITDNPEGLVIDHINGDGLDNRKCNLRICTGTQNVRNQKAKGGTSKYKGVYFNRKHKKFHSRITVNNLKIHLGSFENEEEAAKAYDKAALFYHKEFAKTNFKEK